MRERERSRPLPPPPRRPPAARPKNSTPTWTPRQPPPPTPAKPQATAQDHLNQVCTWETVFRNPTMLLPRSTRRQSQQGKGELLQPDPLVNGQIHAPATALTCLRSDSAPTYAQVVRRGAFMEGQRLQPESTPPTAQRGNPRQGERHHSRDLPEPDENNKDMAQEDGWTTVHRQGRNSRRVASARARRSDRHSWPRRGAPRLQGGHQLTLSKHSRKLRRGGASSV